MKSTCLILILSLLTSACVGIAPGDLALFMLDDHPLGSSCLDGSPYGYYYRPGAETTKWMIFHHGGGWCYDTVDCAERAKKVLGTSTKWPNVTAPYAGIMDWREEYNPPLYNWTVVWLWYCDGGSFTGSRTDPVEYNGTKLYFRGKNNLEATITDLFKTKNLDKATEVLITGSSAGGLATYLHLDWYRNIFPSSVSVKGSADAGWFLDTNSFKGYSIYTPEMQNGFNLWNSTNGVNGDCISAHQKTNDTWRCIFAEYTYPFIKSPIFMVNSKYDSWQMDNIEVLPCAGQLKRCNSTEMTDIIKYGNTFLSTLGSIKASDKDGIFVDACYIHTQCGENTWTSVVVQDNYGNNMTISDAFSNWYNGKPTKIIQTCDYPCNPTCPH